MIRVEIGTSERTMKNASPDWINRQIRGRRDDGQTVCVRVRINCPSVELGLQTSTCPGGGSGRSFTPEEQRVIDLWSDLDLSDPDFTPGNLVAFLKQLEHRLGVC